MKYWDKVLEAADKFGLSVPTELLVTDVLRWVDVELLAGYEFAAGRVVVVGQGSFGAGIGTFAVATRSGQVAVLPSAEGLQSIYRGLKNSDNVAIKFIAVKPYPREAVAELVAEAKALDRTLALAIAADAKAQAAIAAAQALDMHSAPAGSANALRYADLQTAASTVGVWAWVSQVKKQELAKALLAVWVSPENYLPIAARTVPALTVDRSVGYRLSARYGVFFKCVGENGAQYLAAGFPAVEAKTPADAVAWFEGGGAARAIAESAEPSAKAVLVDLQAQQALRGFENGAGVAVQSGPLKMLAASYSDTEPVMNMVAAMLPAVALADVLPHIPMAGFAQGYFAAKLPNAAWGVTEQLVTANLPVVYA